MTVIFKKAKRRNMRDPKVEGQYHPQLLTLGQRVDLNGIAYTMKESSSLSKGDIMSVLANFVEAMRTALFNGYSVNLQDFGVFSLSARTEGSPTEKECTAKKIKAVRINFRPSVTVRPDPAATRVGDKIDFLDLQTYLERLKQSGTEGGGGDDGEDPTV